MENLEKLSDKELVARMNNGQKEGAFSVLYKRYYEKVCGYCNSFCHEEDLSKDLANDTFVKVYKKSGSFNDKWAFSTWLYAIAKNDFIDYIRKNKYEKNLVFSLDSCFSDETSSEKDENYNKRLILSEDDNPESRITRNQKHELFDKAAKKILGRFEVDYFRLMKLYYFDELSIKEVAEKLKIPEGTVKGNIFRVKEILRKGLQSKKDFFWYD